MFRARNAAITAALVLVVAGLSLWINGQVARGDLGDVTFTITIDETDPSSLTAPVDDDCPVGEACKSLSETTIGDDGAPVPSTTTIIPVALEGATGAAIANGRTTGQVHTHLYWALFGECSSEGSVIEDTQPFYDGAVKGEGADDDTAEAINDLSVWPTRLEADLRVSELLSTGHSVERRYVATLVGPFEVAIPVNVLFFDVSDGNGFGGLTVAGTYGVGVIGDPSEPLAVATCAPMETEILLLGQTAEGEVLATCEVGGTHTVTNVLTREVDGSLVFDATATDTVECSGGEPTATPTSTDTPGPSPTDTPTPTATSTPTETPTPEPTPTGTPPTATPTATATSTPTLTPTATPEPPKSILFCGPSLNEGTPNRPENEATLASAAGYDVTIADADTWSAMTTTEFAAYDAIVFGDPVLGVDLSILDTAEATKETWSPAITGQVIVIGADPMGHQIKVGAQPKELTMNAIGFAASGPGVGLYVCLSTYYREAELNTPVSFLSELGDFEVQGQATPPLSDPPVDGCPDDVTIVEPSHPAMSGITEAGLSDWGCSMHEAFNAFPSSYVVLATESNTDLPYILATEEPIGPTPTPTDTATPTETATSTPTDTPTPTGCVFAGDADCDGCWDSVEPTLDPPADPGDEWDFYDVPVPTLFSGGHLSGDASGEDSRDHSVSVLSDMLAVMEYVGTSDGGPANEQGRQYNQDVNGDGVDDGEAYDRSVGATRSGAPDGAISVVVDALAMLDQVGQSCGEAP